MANVDKVVNSIHKKVQIINRTQQVKRFIVRAGAIAMTVLTLVFGSFYVAEKSAGNFQVNIGEGNAAISISDTKDFKKPTTKLYVSFPQRFTNMSYTDLPLETIGSLDGQNNGEDYMEYTFYLKNESDSEIYYERYMPIINVGRRLDEVIRIMIVRNDTEKEYYAKAKNNTENEPEQVYYYDSHAKFDEVIQTTPFIDSETAIKNEVRHMSKGSVDKYTIVIWIEGSDNECNDNRRGGEVKLRLDFNAYLEADYEENHEG